MLDSTQEQLNLRQEPIAGNQQNNAKYQRKHISQKRKHETLDDMQGHRQEDAAKKLWKKDKGKSANIFIARNGLETFNKGIVSCHNIGGMEYKCQACGALMLGSLTSVNPTATFSLCCSHGAVKLPPIKEPSATLKTLLTGSTKKDCDFRENI